MNFLKRNIKEEYSIEDESVLISNEDLSVTYYYDENGNKINDRLDGINERLKDLDINTYNKDEMDLKLENLKLGLHKDVSDRSVDKSKDTNP